MQLARLLYGMTLLLPSLAVAQSAEPTLHLIPMPREIRATSAQPIQNGVRIVGESANPGLSSEDLFTSQDLAQSLAERNISLNGPFTIQLTRTQTLPPGLPPEARLEGYTITPGPNSLTLAAATSTGLFYAAQTLKQLIEHDGPQAILHLAQIRDWPAMRYRGMQDDLSRGPISTLDFQKTIVRTLAAYKVNLYSPYFEDTQQYASNPLFSVPGASISAADARELVAYAAQYHVTVVPDQEAFGHLHHNLLYEQYQPLAETPHGSVLAPGQPGSLQLIHQMFTELAELYPSPFLHLGADETVDLGLGQTKEEVDTRGLGPVYLDFLQKIVADLAPLHRKLLFWGDIAQTIVQGATAYGTVGAPGVAHPDPNLIKNLPDSFKRNTIAVAWWYTSKPSKGFAPFLTPFTQAGIETWVAPGVNNWSRVYPNNNEALVNIQQFVAEGQRQGSTGVLNTTWYDDGEALGNNNWYGLLFGAAASWQQGLSDIPTFQQAYGPVFHGDATGAINQAQLEIMACHDLLQKQAKVGDGSDGLFWADPWSPSGQDNAVKLRPYLHDLRLHAERALTLVAQARAAYPSVVSDQESSPGAPSISQSHRGMGGMYESNPPSYNPANAFPSNPTTLHHTDAIDALELGARRLDFIGLKFQLSDEIAQGYQRALIAQSSPDKKLHATVAHELGDINNAVNSRTRDLRDQYSLLRDLYQQAWLRSNRPYALQPVLEHFDSAIQLWQTRIDRINQARHQLTQTHQLPPAADLGIPPAPLSQ
jgi:hexosaminidase